jgi:hypothetical protein
MECLTIEEQYQEQDTLDCTQLCSTANRFPSFQVQTPYNAGLCLAMRSRVDLLLRNGADMNPLTDKKITPLFLAAQDGQIEIFKQLIL